MPLLAHILTTKTMVVQDALIALIPMKTFNPVIYSGRVILVAPISVPRLFSLVDRKVNNYTGYNGTFALAVNSAVLLACLSIGVLSCF